MLVETKPGAAGARKTRRRRYALFGLTVESDIELSRVASAAPGAGVDVAIVRRPISHPALGSGKGMTVALDLPRQLFAWDTVGSFVVASEQRIEVDPLPDVPDALVALPLLGIVFAALLHRRGLFVLHASAVSVDGAGVALLGDKGAGKSTTAAALVAAGHALLADDVVAIDFDDPGGPVIVPAFGQLKLWDEALDAIPLAAENRGRLHPSLTKSSYALRRGFADAPAPLTRLYVLSRGDPAGVSEVDAATAVAALLRFSYLGRFGEAGLGPGLAQQFQRGAAFAHRGLVQTLTVPALADISEAVAEIEADVMQDVKKEHLG